MANVAPYGTNAFGVEARDLDYNVADAPTTMTYHGASIVVNGNIIGRIQQFQAAGAYTRDGEHVYELSRSTWGRPVDYVPGKQTGYTLTMTRVEVWFQEMEIAFGFPAVFDDLGDQNRPFTIFEYLFRGNTLYRVWRYTGCWFQNKTVEAIEAEGNGKVTVSSEMAYVRRARTV